MSEAQAETLPETTPEEVRTVIASATASMPPTRVVAIRAGDLRKIGFQVDKAVDDLRPVEVSVAQLRAKLAKK